MQPHQVAELDAYIYEFSKRMLEERKACIGGGSAPGTAVADLLNSVLDTVHYALTRLARHYNSTTPAIRELPGEVIGYAFAFLSVQERILVSHVCSFFRRAALEDPTLWAALRFDDRLSLKGAQELLERSKTVPLTLRVRRAESGPQDTLRCLSLHMGHIRTLDLEAGMCDEQDLTKAFAGSAPLLRTLRVRTSLVGDLCPDLLRSFHAPNLLHLSVPEGSLSALFSNTKHGLLAVRVLLCDYITSARTVLEACRTFPALESLVVSVQHHFHLDDAPPGSHPITQLKRLELMHSASVTDEALVRLLTALNHADIPILVATALRTPAMQFILAPLTRIEHMALRIGGHMPVADVEVRGSGRARAFLCVRHDVAVRYLATASFAHLVALTIHEGLWPMRAALPFAPVLRRLSVVLTSPAQHAFARKRMLAVSLGIFFLERGRPFVTPSLRALCLACGSAWRRHPARRLVVSALDVSEFLSAALLVPVGRPPVLVLRNVDLLEAPHSEAHRTLSRKVASIAFESDATSADDDELPPLLRPAMHEIFGSRSS